MSGGLFSRGGAQAATGGVAVIGNVTNSTIITGLSPEEQQRWMQASQAERDSLIRAAEAAQRDLGATVTLVQAFLRTMLDRDVPPDQFAATLMELAASWKATGARIEAKRGAANLFPEVEALRQQAEAAYEAERLTEVQALLAEIDRRETEAMAALRQLLDAQQASNVATKQGRVDVALSLGDAAEAGRLIAEIVALETPEAARFDELLRRGEEWLVRGHDRGLNLDLKVAIALTRAALAAAKGPDQRGAGLNGLGTALATLGERESAHTTLRDAVDVFRATLKEYTRDRVPIQWAKTQNNLGSALRALGQRQSGTDNLCEAVDACRAALQVVTRDRTPLDWAAIQNNLGAALMTLGQRDSDPATLREAVDAHRAALEEWTRDSMPVQWAMALTNLGSALAMLGQRDNDPATLRAAVDAYRTALDGHSRDRVPLLWATMQTNLGAVLRELGQRESGTDTLGAAVDAFRAALEEFTRDRVPLQWALTQNNLGTALQKLGERESGTETLREAVVAYHAALEERTRDRVPLNWAATQNNLGKALLALGERENDPAIFRTAVDAFRAALEERTRDRVPLDWAMSTGNQGVAMALLADRTGDRAMTAAAVAQIAAARDLFREAGHAPYSAYYSARLSEAEAIRDRLASL
jgi:tetratricopeptide (TPR) repeat protein